MLAFYDSFSKCAKKEGRKNKVSDLILEGSYLGMPCLSNHGQIWCVEC